MKKYDCVIVGGGVIGLAIARELALSNLQVMVLEAKTKVGQETSFRNSAVSHAGIYYPSGSLKARLCVFGQKLLQTYCEQKKIPYRKMGKIIVATDPTQIKQLEQLYQQGEKNEVKDLVLLEGDVVTQLEPKISAVAGLLSPSTATLDGQQLVQHLSRDIEELGGTLLTEAAVTHCEILSEGFLTYTNHPRFSLLQSRFLINAAGLLAQEVAQRIQGLNPSTIPPIYFAKGNYFKYLAESPFTHLIYPIPEKGGLGIHATLDTQNNLRFGPDVEWVQTLNFTTDLSIKSKFVAAIQQYYPDLNPENLVPDSEHTGIRPKLSLTGVSDFIIQTEKNHNIKGLVQLFGMESPGLTASLAIADFVTEFFFYVG